MNIGKSLGRYYQDVRYGWKKPGDRERAIKLDKEVKKTSDEAFFREFRKQKLAAARQRGIAKAHGRSKGRGAGVVKGLKSVGGAVDKFNKKYYIDLSHVDSPENDRKRRKWDSL